MMNISKHSFMRLTLASGIMMMAAACGDTSTSTDNGSRAVEEARAGTQEHIVLASEVDGADISFELFEPDTIEPGKSYPLVLHGHGYGGSRSTARSGFIARLTAAGYYVISIDQRGFGESGGTVRVLSPDFEGRDLIQIVNWAEDLPGLARDASGNMQLGSFGGSYGGGYQLLILRMDPKNRLDALAPDITWHDLRYSLNPNNVIKSGWILVLVAGGETGSNLGQDNFIREALLEGIVTNNFPEPASNAFAYHSPIFNCEMQDFQDQNFLVASSDPGEVEARPLPAADILITQGMPDTLFNFNDAFANYQCMKNSGGDVRLLTHQSGHILPVALPEELKDAIDPLSTLVNIPEFQDGGGSRSCGSQNLDDVQFAWFEEKLKGVSGAVDAVLQSGSDVCLSLAEGDAIAVPEVTVGGTDVPLDISTPQFNSVTGIVGSLLGNGIRELALADIPLMTAEEDGLIVAGIPTLQLEIAGLTGLEMADCLAPINLGCDPIYWLGLGVRKAGQSRVELIDDQLTPLRGFGQFGTAEQAMPMTGVAERLDSGDQLLLQIYAFHAQYPVSWSRDLLVPAAQFSGSIQVPVLSPEMISQQGL